MYVRERSRAKEIKRYIDRQSEREKRAKDSKRETKMEKKEKQYIKAKKIKNK